LLREIHVRGTTGAPFSTLFRRATPAFVKLSQKIAARPVILLRGAALAGSNPQTGEFRVRRTFIVALIAGVIALSGGIALYKSQPLGGGRTTKAESAKTAN
jgi:hypothetical protein